MRGKLGGITRRGLGALALGGLCLPKRLYADPISDRKFLFIYCVGGWDPTWVFAPLFGSSGVDMDPDSEPGSAGGIAFTDSVGRPTVRTFLERYGSRTCFINGFEVRSVTHERCRRILFTGSSGADADDWPSIAAGMGSNYLLPSLVLSGPSYSSVFGSAVVRVGANGQLASLLDSTAFLQGDENHSGLSADVNALVNARVRARVDAAAAEAGGGRLRSFLDNYGASLDRAEDVAALAGEIDLAAPPSSGCVALSDTVFPGLSCLEKGYARSVVIQHGGFCDLGWDSHSGIELQGTNFELLFQDLETIMSELDARTGVSGGPLSEEVTVVVVSEMGRTPKVNSTGGKDHWTYTSAMIVGGGVAGGKVIGAYDDAFIGRSIDLSSGAVDAAGTPLSSAHLGATLLAMADIDPAEFTSAEPIAAAIL